MMRLQWFSIKDLIPDNSIYVKSKIIVTGTKTVSVEDWPPYGGGGVHSEEQDVTEDMYLFQVPEPL